MQFALRGKLFSTVFSDTVGTFQCKESKSINFADFLGEMSCLEQSDRPVIMGQEADCFCWLQTPHANRFSKKSENFFSSCSLML